MTRVLIKIYSYECDVSSCDAMQDITQGDAIPIHPGSFRYRGAVHSADDADRVMRYRFGWKIGKHYHQCPRHEGA